MFKKFLGLFVVISILGMTLCSCNKEQRPSTDEELCSAVFEALQNNDAELFKSLLITEKTFQGMINSLDESDPKEKSIKDEFSKDFNVEKIAGASLKSFHELAGQAQENDLDFKNAVYSGIHFNQVRYEAGNHICKKLKFKITAGEEFYSAIVYLFQTDEGMFTP
mgnify:CR=1 FL=1